MKSEDDKINKLEHHLNDEEEPSSLSSKKEDMKSEEFPEVNLSPDDKHTNLFEEDKAEYLNAVSDPECFNENDEDIVTIPQSKNQLLIGDTLLRVKHKGAFSNTLVCRIWFNTAFTFSTKMTYTIKDIDPVNIRKDERYSPDFAITLETEPFCRKCNSLTPISDFCRSCQINLDDEIKKWKKIHWIIEKHKSDFKPHLNFKSAAAMHYLHSDKNDYVKVLGLNSKFRKQSFRWSKHECDCAMLWDNSDSEESEFSGSEEREDEKEFDNDLFKNDIGQVIHDHNEEMHKINSVNTYNMQPDLQRKEEAILEAKQRETMATNTTLESGLLEPRMHLNNLLDLGAVIEENKDLFESVEEKVHITPQEDYFDYIQNQFMTKASSSSPRKWIFRKQTGIDDDVENLIDDEDGNKNRKSLALFRKSSSVERKYDNAKVSDLLGGRDLRSSNKTPE